MIFHCKILSILEINNSLLYTDDDTRYIPPQNPLINLPSSNNGSEPKAYKIQPRRDKTSANNNANLGPLFIKIPAIKAPKTQPNGIMLVI